jgi:hypothetical protein
MTEIPSWTLEAGAVLSHRDRRLQYGGAPYGGIEQSAQSLNVFIYSDPSAGAAWPTAITTTAGMRISASSSTPAKDVWASKK